MDGTGGGGREEAEEWSSPGSSPSGASRRGRAREKGSPRSLVEVLAQGPTRAPVCVLEEPGRRQTRGLVYHGGSRVGSTRHGVSPLDWKGWVRTE